MNNKMLTYLMRLNFSEWVHLNENKITGSIPTKIGLATTLEYVHLDGNLLTGTLPTELGVLADLRMIQMHHNYIRYVLS